MNEEVDYRKLYDNYLLQREELLKQSEYAHFRKYKPYTLSQFVELKIYFESLEEMVHYSFSATKG